MHRHMENPNIGPRDLISCFGIQDTVFQTPCSKISTSHPGIGSGFNPYFSGSERTPSKRGCQNYALYKRRVLQLTVSCPKKGWTSASGDRPECSKQVHYKRSFPDGKSKFSKDVALTRGLYDKYRLKRRIPFSCCSRKFTKVPQFYMGREVLPIQSSPIRPVFGSEDIHETVKTGCCLPKKERHPSAYLSGRFSSPGSNKGRSNQKYSNVSSTPPVPRFHSKPQGILTNSNANDYLPGFQHRFKVIDNCTSSSKGPEDYGMLPEPDNFTNSHIAKRSKPDRPSGVLSASHLAFSPSFSPLADGSDGGPTDESGMLRLTDSPFTGLQERTRLVAGKYSQCKQQPCAPASSRPSNYNRRFEERLGRSAPVIEDQRQMVRTRITPTHQLLGVESSLPSSEVVSQRQISLDRVSKVRQHNSYCVHKQQRGNTFTPTPNLSSGVVGLVSNKRHLSDSHSCPRKRQCLCRHGIENIQGHERLEVESHHNPTISAGLPDRSVRKSPDHPTEELHQLEARSRGHPHRCLNNTLGSSEGICISTVQSDIQDSREGHDRQGGDNSGCSSLASPTLVASPVETPDIATSSPSEQSNSVIGPIRPQEGSPNVPSLTPGRLSHLYQRFQAEGIPTDVAKLLIAATRSSTHKTYNSSWNRWCRWCSGRKIDPLHTSISDILTFLTEAFNKGLAYRSLNVLRSAISSTHPAIDGYHVGQHPYVTRLLRGALNSRPPKPRYTHTWNVDVMVKYIVSLDKNRSLALKVISMKLVTLFALTCPERISALATLDLRHCSIHPEGVSFKLTTPRKSGSADKLAEAFFARFDQDKRLCSVECLRQYLKSTRDIRPVIPSSQPDRLFISFIRPHKPVTSTTLGRWLRNFMKAAGIDSKIFKAHSVRGASTTAAANAFVPLSTIMAMADWSSSSTFRTFYYKPLFNSDFATGVLSSK